MEGSGGDVGGGGSTAARGVQVAGGGSIGMGIVVVASCVVDGGWGLRSRWWGRFGSGGMDLFGIRRLLGWVVLK